MQGIFSVVERICEERDFCVTIMGTTSESHFNLARKADAVFGALDHMPSKRLYCRLNFQLFSAWRIGASAVLASSVVARLLEISSRRSYCQTLAISFSSLKSPKSRTMNQMKDLTKSGVPTWLVKNIYSELQQINPSFLPIQTKAVSAPKIEFSRVEKKDVRGSGSWKCQIIVDYPSLAVFEATCSTKKKAQDKACVEVVNMLRKKLLVSASFKPVLNIAEQQKMLSNQNAPLEIKPLSSDTKQQMLSFYEKFESQISPIMEQHLSSVKLQNYSPLMSYLEELDEDLNLTTNAVDTNEGSEIDQDSFSSDVVNLLTGKPWSESPNLIKERRSRELSQFLNTRDEYLKGNVKHRSFMASIQTLPIYGLKESIVETIEKNRVTIIAGETACGKTTQIPLFVFEHYIKLGKGAECNMVITQPRRLPAISVAEQVAFQFGENTVGNSVGYQVRFEKVLPSHSDGALLFCTAGILLKKMERNQNLCGITHLFLDEVHERDVTIDFLLILVKRLLRQNDKLKVILMSASLNAKLFAQYFEGSASVDIKGRLFPVEKYYLPEVLRFLGREQENRTMLTNMKIDKFLVCDLINHIDKKANDDGAILCFLPGWAEIMAVKNTLESYERSSGSRFLTVPVHSNLSHSQQKLIFTKAPPGYRKVVLSTNIAETSITVPDVVHVIDPGLCKEVYYDKLFNVSKLGVHWISAANAIQREGRAGRVQPGYCYKLYSEDVEKRMMNPFPTPEILRVPLETVVMQSKIYHPTECVQTFLAESIQPPSSVALSAAVATLASIGVLDEQENLTLLGQKVVGLPMHPRLSVALFSSAFFGCFNLVSNVVSMLSSTRDIFDLPPEEKSTAKEIKSHLCNGVCSDHIVLSKILKLYEDSITSFNGGFCRSNRLHEPTLKVALDSKAMTLKLMMPMVNVFGDHINENRRSLPMIHAALLSGFYRNLVRFVYGREVRGKVKKGTRLIEVNTGRITRILSNSVITTAPKTSEELDVGSSFGFGMYFGSFFSEEARRLTIRDVTFVPPLTVLLFAGMNWSESHSSTGDCVICVDDNPYLKFKVKAEDVELLKSWKMTLCKLSFWFLCASHQPPLDEELAYVLDSLQQFLLISHKMIESNPQTQ